MVIEPDNVINAAYSEAVSGLFDATALMAFAHTKATIRSIKNIKIAT